MRDNIYNMHELNLVSAHITLAYSSREVFPYMNGGIPTPGQSYLRSPAKMQIVWAIRVTLSKELRFL